MNFPFLVKNKVKTTNVKYFTSYKTDAWKCSGACLMIEFMFQDIVNCI